MHQGLLLYFLCVISLIDAFTVKRLLRLRPVIRSIEVQKEGTALINNDPINEDMISSLINSCALQTAGTEENEILRVSSALGRKLLSQLKQPHRKDEAWRHTNLKKLFSHKFRRHSKQSTLSTLDDQNIRSLIDEQCTTSCLVFIDGLYSPKHSSTAGIPTGLIAQSIRQVQDADIMGHIKDITNAWVPDLMEPPRNSFGSDLLTALNKAGAGDVACVLVPPGVTVAVPIQVLFCNTAVASDISKVQPGSVDVSTTAATSGINGIIGADAVNTARDEGKGDSSRVCFPGLVVSVGAGAKLHLKQSYHTLTLTPRPSSSSSTIDYAIDTADMVAPTMAKAEREEGSASTHSPLTEPSPNIVVGAECAAATDPQQSPLTVNSPGMVVAGTTVWLGEKAVFTHTYVQDLAESVRHLDVVTANLSAKHSSYDATVLQCGGLVSRVNVHVNMLAQHSNCTLNGITLAGTGQSLDLHSSIFHNNTQGVSRQQQRNVIADKGEAIFKGRIRIPKEAQETDSDQLCRSIMLGARARLQVMPTLEISADNVVCSHGASVVDLDENSMFYLASRGIDRGEARKLLLTGFVFDLLKEHIMDDKGNRRIIQKVQSLYPVNETARAETAPSAQKYMSI